MRVTILTVRAALLLWCGAGPFPSPVRRPLGSHVVIGRTAMNFWRPDIRALEDQLIAKAGYIISPKLIGVVNAPPKEDAPTAVQEMGLLFRGERFQESDWLGDVILGTDNGAHRANGVAVIGRGSDLLADEVLAFPGQDVGGDMPSVVDLIGYVDGFFNDELKNADVVRVEAGAFDARGDPRGQPHPFRLSVNQPELEKRDNRKRPCGHRDLPVRVRLGGLVVGLLLGAGLCDYGGWVASGHRQSLSCVALISGLGAGGASILLGLWPMLPMALRCL